MRHDSRHAIERKRTRRIFAALVALVVINNVTPASAQQRLFEVPVPGTTPDMPPIARDDRAAREAAIEANKSYLVPALEIPAFQALLNLHDRAVYGSHDYGVTPKTVWHNLTHGWVVDNDPYSINQFLHPYQGSIYHGFARSAGLSYWQSAGYTFAGSLLWEIAGETTPPSKNDQIASGIAGSFLGEALFRMASLVLEKDELPAPWNEIAAALISPPTGFNRLAFGNRFRTIFPSGDPERYSRFSVGYAGTTQNDPGTATKLHRNEGIVEFAMDYGLPGKPGYTYARPFDYFAVQSTLSTANGFENILTRGLLLGTDYGVGDNYRGIWGLYGSYDYIAPQLFRISSTALSIGTTGQIWLSDTIAVQGTGLLGTGYAAVGTLHGTGDQDYHYGVAPQALAALRFIFDGHASIDVTAREYFVSRVGGAGTSGKDNIIRTDAALTVPVYGRHAVSLRYQLSRRDASVANFGDLTQTRGTIGIFYTLLGHHQFGAVDWRH
jgi:hypothetical protein